MDFGDAEGGLFDKGNAQAETQRGIAGDDADGDAERPEGRSPSTPEGFNEAINPACLFF